MPFSEPDSCASPGSHDDRLTGSDRLALAFCAADPARAARDCEQLERRGRVPGDHASGLDFDHDDVRAGRQSPHAGADAPGGGHLALAREHDPPHAASSISRHASANCSSLSRMCE